MPSSASVAICFLLLGILSSFGLLYLFSFYEKDLMMPLYQFGFLSDKAVKEIRPNISAQKKLWNDLSKAENLKEALAALKAAQDLHKAGKHDKALKVYQHALALQPNHPDVLTHYGEFVEQVENNTLLAEHMYAKALIISPRHERALINRQRTGPVVEELDNLQFRVIDEKRDRLVQVPPHHPGLRRMQWEHYFQHIYHTNALEGNTMTLLQTRTVLETNLAIGGKSIPEHNEIIGMHEAMRYVNHTLLSRIGSDISLTDILEIHRRVLGHVDPVEAGQLRSTQVFIGDYRPPPATKVVPQMENFLNWLNSPETVRNLHPIQRATFAHYKLVAIHPFFDGNGRTARLLMNLILMQAGYPPILIRVDDRHQYYFVIKAANDGDIRPFVRFVSQCTEDTIDQFLEATADETFEVTAPQLEDKHDEERIFGNIKYP